MQRKEKAKVNIGIDMDISILESFKVNNDYVLLNGNSLTFLRYLIDKYNDGTQKILVYLDPPYLHETRSCLDRCKYKYELTNQGHKQLLDLVCTIDKNYPNIYIMISGYKSELYMSMLHGWSYFETQTMSRGGKRTESLWTNFNPELYIKHDYNYVGHNFTDRQRIKRKSERWIKNLKNMPLDEKMYILKMISHSYNNLLVIKNKEVLNRQDDLYWGKDKNVYPFHQDKTFNCPCSIYKKEKK